MAEPQLAEPHFDDRLWGGLALRGVIAILFGILALSRPGITVEALVYLFGAYVFINGIFALVASVNVAELHGRWGGMLLVGLLEMVIGVLAFTRPLATTAGLVFYIAIWAVVTGILEIAAAFRLRNVIPDEWMLAIAGLLSIAFGVVVFARPDAGLLSIVWGLGMFAIIFGVLQVGLGFRIHGTQKRLASV